VGAGLLGYYVDWARPGESLDSRTLGVSALNSKQTAAKINLYLIVTEQRQGQRALSFLFQACCHSSFSAIYVQSYWDREGC
jgi:hypothetical protein